MRKLSAALHEDAAFQNVSRRTVDLINTVANSSLEIEEGKERVDMCKAIEDMLAVSKAEGEARGRAEGRAEGEVKGRTETLREIFEKMIASGVDEQKAKEFLGLA